MNNDVVENLVKKWAKENKLNKEHLTEITEELKALVSIAFNFGMEEADENAYDEGYQDGLTDAEEELMSNC